MAHRTVRFGAPYMARYPIERPDEYVTTHLPPAPHAYSSGYQEFPQNKFLNHSNIYGVESQDRYPFYDEAPYNTNTYRVDGRGGRGPRERGGRGVGIGRGGRGDITGRGHIPGRGGAIGGARGVAIGGNIGGAIGGARGGARGVARGGNIGGDRGGNIGGDRGGNIGGARGGNIGGARGGNIGGARGGNSLGLRGGSSLGNSGGGWNSSDNKKTKFFPSKKVIKFPWTAAGKHPMLAIMELKPKTVFKELSRKLCPKSKVWTMKVNCTVDGQSFEGEGVTVKIAKAEAAIVALKALNANGVSNMSSHIPEKEMEKIERLNQQDTDHINSITVAPSNPVKKMKSNDGQTIPRHVPRAPEFLNTPENNPMLFVNLTYGPDVKTEFELLTKQPQPPVFRCTMVVQGTTFIKTGSNKKKARHSCAEACLTKFKSNPPPIVNVVKLKDAEKDKKEEPEKVVEVTGPLTFQDKLLDRCFQEIIVVSKDLNPRYIKMRNFAAIIVKDGVDEDLEKCETIAMATGTSCVHMENMKPDGNIIHDCTADALVRRGLKLYLFDELIKAIDGTSSIFQESGKKEKKKYSLKPNISLIFLKNVAPRGDGRGNKDPEDHSQNLEMLTRTRKRKFEESAKPGEFPLIKPYIDGSLQVFFSRKETTIPPYQFIEGEIPHVISSPCDKIALHNICGYQGALLSQFIDPVYASTFCIRTLYSEPLLKRAFYERIETVSGMSGVTGVPAPFKQTKPTFLHIQGENRKSGSQTGFAFVWVKNREYEVIRIPYGKRQLLLDDFPEPNKNHTVAERKTEFERLIAERDASAIPSSVCKQAMFGNYRLICDRLGRVPSDSYKDAKQAATEYQKVKNIVYDKFCDAGLGHWPVKSEDMNNFCEFIARQ